jgi:hypothetical protein
VTYESGQGLVPTVYFTRKDIINNNIVGNNCNNNIVGNNCISLFIDLFIYSIQYLKYTIMTPTISEEDC